MIERFYEPLRNQEDKTIGQIMFDGKNINNIKLKSLRESIGYVP